MAVFRVAAAGILCTACAFAQARFDVASIKPSKLAGEGRNRESTTANPGSLIMHNVTLRSALQWAYRMKEYQVSGPAWIGDDRFDISAKAATAVPEPQLRGMLQRLLSDRFKLVTHREKKNLPVYVLIVAKGVPKLTPGNPNGTSEVQPHGMAVTLQDTSMGEFADLMTLVALRMNLPPVIDRTGLTGRYKFTVDGSSFLQSLGAGNAIPDSPTIVNAVMEVLVEQLGLKAELRKAPTDVLIVDKAEKVPTEN